MSEGGMELEALPVRQVAWTPNRLTEERASVAARPLSAEPLALGVVSDAQGFAALRPEWEALLEASDAALFNAWGWLYPWWQRIAPDREPWIFTARDRGGALVGLLPLGLEVRSVAGVRVRRLAFLGETHEGSDYLGLLAPRGHERALAETFAQGLLASMDGWDVLELTDLRDDSPLLEALTEVFQSEGLRCAVQPRYTCPCETFEPGETFDAFLRRTGRRDNYQRRRRWLERQPGFELDLRQTPGELSRALADFQTLHRARWEEDGGSQGIKGPSVEAFHRDATQWLAETGKTRLYTLRLGEKALASVYGLVHRGEFLYFQSGFDPAWRSKSVGLVLVGETFRDSLAAGLRSYDFLRGTEPYKAEWTHQTRHTVSLRIHARRGAGAWFTRHERWAATTRRWAKALLPGAAVERVRRVRRRHAAI
jgi:CelD/BcsL family acetyltransferase involved in cellulose biosynthesis